MKPVSDHDYHDERGGPWYVSIDQFVDLEVEGEALRQGSVGCRSKFFSEYKLNLFKFPH